MSDHYDRLLAARRLGCYCAPYSKPCPECGSYGDGLEAGIDAMRVAALADGTAPTEPTGAVGGGAGLIAAERLRQVTAEGWTPEHDAEHAGGDLAMAAAAYAIHDANGCPLIARGFALWPFEPNGWKPRGQIDNLVRAGALIAAEIDRLNGTAPTEPAPTGLEPGEIVAVPADLRDDPNGVQWEWWDQCFQNWHPCSIKWPLAERRTICRPVQNGDPR